MEPFAIFNAVQRFNDRDDMRPWLIVELRRGLFTCFPIASECYDGSCFPLDQTHPDFPATGLSKSCYIMDQRFYELGREQFGGRRGRLQGDLLAEFRRYAGL